ncbi:hypothetical protein GCM10028895_52580 [Pontibacter rugosus]
MGDRCALRYQPANGPADYDRRTAAAGRKVCAVHHSGEKEWTVIINRNWEQHLADNYTEAEDVVRFSVEPETATQHQERLRYEVVPEGQDKGAVVMTWDKLKLTLPVGV